MMIMFPAANGEVWKLTTICRKVNDYVNDYVLFLFSINSENELNNFS